MIHPSAIIHPDAQLDATVRVGPCAVIDAHVVLGADCVVGPLVHLTGHTTIGARNVFHAGCVIGDIPQDLKYKGAPARLHVGDRNVFRENVTVHHGNDETEATVIGSHNLLMAGCHIAHNAQLGNHVIIANGALLGGHVIVQDRALISGNCLLHQFVRVGTLAMMQGGSGIGKDLPPFCVARGVNGMCGLNTLGLRRAGFTSAQRLELRRLYHALFRSGRKLSEAAAEARAAHTTGPARTLLDFVAEGKRGICSDTGKADSAADED